MAQEYKDIFPSSPDKVDLINSYLDGILSCTYLDIGCASGELAMQLSSPQRSIIGIDLDPAMINQARKEAVKTAAKNLQFKQADMLHFLHHSDLCSFDLITCLGNTLVYLNGKQELKCFLEGAKNALRKKGHLLLQILNYGNPQIGPGFNFPVVKGKGVELSRSYSKRDSDVQLSFHSQVKNLETEEIESDIHLHYPFQSSQINDIAIDLGFSSTKVFGNYEKKKAETSDFFHLIVLEK